MYVGRAHILKALPALFGPEGLVKGQLNNYMMLQPIIDVAPDNRTAKARWRSDIEVAVNGKGEWGEGEYENEYVNEHGVWKISKLHFYITVMADYDKGWREAPIPMDGASTQVPPDRPPDGGLRLIARGLPSRLSLQEPGNRRAAGGARDARAATSEMLPMVYARVGMTLNRWGSESSASRITTPSRRCSAPTAITSTRPCGRMSPTFTRRMALSRSAAAACLSEKNARSNTW